MDLFYKLPQELINHIYEYNAEHREKMYWNLRYISEKPFCEGCDKIIMKYIWSSRRGDEVCCSPECVDNDWVSYGKKKWWM